jgi:4-diphosphocytidyl-2-C-methyl-D-erythritol kinase
MTSERNTEAFAVQAPAKVNLFLEVLAKRPDGYHDLETLLVAVDLYDSLEFHAEATGALSLSCDDPGLSCGPDNLVLRAATKLRQHTGCSQGARIHLRKRIPMQAGLAGGSSDAAATLSALNRLWYLGLSRDELLRIGAELGSDVNFFFAAPAAWCTGRGERVERQTLGRTLDFVLAHPGVGLSTAQVFREVRVPEHPLSGAAIREAVGRGDVEEVGRLLHNRLQEPAEALCPAVRVLRNELEAAGPARCLMTGSGSSVFALCRDRPEALRVASRLDAVVPNLSGTESPTPAGVPGGRWKLHVVRSCV